MTTIDPRPIHCLAAETTGHVHGPPPLPPVTRGDQTPGDGNGQGLTAFDGRHTSLAPAPPGGFGAPTLVHTGDHLTKRQKVLSCRALSDGETDDMTGGTVGAVTVPADDFDTQAVAPTSASASRDFKVSQHIAVRTDALSRSPGAKVLKKQRCEVTESEDPLR